MHLAISSRRQRFCAIKHAPSSLTVQQLQGTVYYAMHCSSAQKLFARRLHAGDTRNSFFISYAIFERVYSIIIKPIMKRNHLVMQRHNEHQNEIDETCVTDSRIREY